MKHFDLFVSWAKRTKGIDLKPIVDEWEETEMCEHCEFMGFNYDDDGNSMCSRCIRTVKESK